MKISLPLNIEIPSNPTDFNLGLMFRESLDQNSGMLFVFEETGQKSFHMKDTKIPLDIAFIEENGTIESIKELLPLSVIPISSDGQVLYALEVNRGWFKENNIEVGDNIFESDLASRKKELRLRQIDQQKKWRPNTTSIQRAREKEQMKKEIKQELSQQESVTIENSDGVTFARIMDIVGPAQMKPVVNSDGVWKGTEVVEGVGAIAGGAAKVALGGAAVAGKVAVKGAKFAGKTAAYLGKKAGNRIGKELVKATSDVDNNADKEFDKVKVKRYKETPVKEEVELDENRMAAYTAGAGEGSPASRPTVSKKTADRVSRSSDERAFGNRKKKEGIRLSPTKKYSGKDKGKVVKRANTTGRGTPVQYRKSHEDPDMGRYQQKVTQGSGSIKDIKSSFSNWRNELLGEEGYDRMRDDRLVKYGIGHDGSDRKGPSPRPTGDRPKGKTVYQKQAEKEHGKGVTALDIVKKNIEKKHGKGAIMDTKKK